MLTIRLFGAPEVLQDGKVVHINRRKSRALLYYLAAQVQPVQRAQMLEMFWIDLPRPKALQSQRTTLYGLRRALGEAVQIEDDQIQLQSGVDVDARRFHSQLVSLEMDTQELVNLVDLYRGDFLEGFSVPDSQAFEDWLMIERERFRRLAIRALSALSKRHEENNDFHAAITALDRALGFDALQEDLHRERIRVLYRSGDRPGAIRHYDHLRRMLDEEMGMPPMKETRDLYDALVNDRLDVNWSPSSAVIHRPAPLARSREMMEQIPFTGRQSELRRLHERLGPGKLVLIEGEPGIGKTRLAQEYLRSYPTFVMTVAARELEHALPYLPWIEGFRSLFHLQNWPRIQQSLRANLLTVWWRELVRLVPELGGQMQDLPQDYREPDEARLWEGIHQFLRQLVNQQPLLIFLDDLHWADAASLGLLGYLVRQDDIQRISYLATSRDIQPGSPEAALVQSLGRSERLERFMLERFTKSDLSVIAQSLAPDYVYPFTEWLQRNSEGNPYILNELIRHLKSAQILKSGGQIDLSALSTTPLVPKTVYLLIQGRLEQLSDQARRFLDAAVAAGREFELEIVARAAALSDEAAMEAASELEVAGLILPQAGMHYIFDHSLIMEVAYQEIGEPRHRLLHRRLAEALEASLSRRQLDELAGELAAHFIEGNAVKRAAPYAFRAGEQAARLAAWHEAIDFFHQALLGFEDENRFPVLMALGQAYMASGALQQASDAYQQALDLATARDNREQMDRAALALGRAFLTQGRYQDTIVLARQVLEDGLAINAVSAEFTWGTALSLEGAHLEEAARHLRLAQDLCCGMTDSESLNQINQARILFELGGIAAQRGDLTEAIDLYRQVMELACDSGDDGVMWCVLAHNNLAYHLHLTEDSSALVYVETGLSMAQANGQFELLPYLYSTIGEIALDQAGDYQAAGEYFRHGLQLAERFAMEERIAGLTANLGRLDLKRGNIDKAVHHLSVALQKAEDLGTRHQWAQIQLWLAPLLPADERRERLRLVREFAEPGGRKTLLDQIEQIELL